MQTGPGLLQQLEKVPAFRLFGEQLKVRRRLVKGNGFPEGCGAVGLVGSLNQLPQCCLYP